MKARIPKSYLDLPKKEKDKIDNVARDIAIEIVDEKIGDILDENAVVLQKRWLQLSCIILADSCQFDETKLRGYLVAWKRMYSKIGKMQNDAQVERFLGEQMQRIFGENGYPYEWIEDLARPKKNGDVGK